MFGYVNIYMLLFCVQDTNSLIILLIKKMMNVSKETIHGLRKIKSMKDRITY